MLKQFNLLRHRYKLRFAKLVVSITTYLILCLDTSLAQPVVLDLNHKKIDFSSLRGKWILVNFWASWCEPCLLEIQEFNKLAKKHQNTMRIFAVNFDSLNEAAQKTAADKFAIEYPSILQNSATNLKLGDIPVIPLTYVYNPEGKLITKLYGGQTVASIEKALNLG